MLTIKEITINSWSELVDFYKNNLSNANTTSNDYCFRGLSNTNHALETSLCRLLKGNKIQPADALNIENEMISSFRKKFNTIASKLDYLQTLAYMQHLGIPTRLMDWTKSFWVAAYFATKSNPKDNCAIWITHTDSLKHKKNKNELRLPDNSSEYEKFFSDTNPQELGIVIPHKKVSDIERLNKRLVAQEGFFYTSTYILDDFPQLLFNTIPSYKKQGFRLRKVIIPANLKAELLEKIDKEKGINAIKLFPDDDGKRDHIRDQAYINAHKSKSQPLP